MTNDTQNRAETNRANAQHSTGPKSEAGKQRSSLNALRNGLTGHTIVLPSDDLAAYKTHTARFAEEYQPKGVTEQHLVQMLSDTAWRLHRIPAMETNLLSLAVVEHADSINTADPAVHAALAMAKALQQHPRTFANLAISDQRLSRKFEKTLNQLRQIQSERRRQEQQQMEQAAKLLELHKKERTPFAPTELGFEFSNAQIEHHIHRCDRLAKAEIYDSEHRRKRMLAA